MVDTSNKLVFLRPIFAYLLSILALQGPASFLEAAAADDSLAVANMAKAKSEPEQARFERDLALVAAVNTPNWQSLPPVGFLATSAGLLNPDGHAVLEVAAQPASILLEYGLQNAVCRRFRRGQRFCTLAIFDFGSESGAYGAYSVLREGASTVKVRGFASSEDDSGIQFCQGNFLICLTTTSKEDDEAKEALTVIADSLNEKLPPGGSSPTLLNRLPQYERVAGSERFFLGSIAARRFVQIPFVSNLLIEKGKGAVTADYQISAPYSERLKLLLIDYGTKALASSAFVAYKQNLAEIGKMQTESAEGFLTKVSGGFLKAQLEGAQIVVIAGARKKSSPDYLYRQLKRAPI